MITGDYINDTTCSKQSFHVKVREAINYKSKSTFDCTVLPVCEISCGGPDTHIVNSASKSCSCMGEWLFNSQIFQTVVAVCVYVILNISRVLICRGAVMILWQSLTLQEFEVKSTYSYVGGGTMIKGNFLSFPKDRNDKNDISKRLLQNYKVNAITSKREHNLEEDERLFLTEDKHTPFEKTINQSIEQLVKTFIIKGYFYLILGILINALWLTVVLQAQQNITYNPNK